MTRSVVLLLGCVLVSVAHAGPVSFSYSGRVDQVFRSPPAPFAAVQVGDEVLVDYVLEVETPDQDAVAGAGTFSGAVVEYEVTIGGSSISTVFGGVNTLDAGALSPQDTYAAIGLFDDFSASVSFQDPSGTAIGPEDNLQSIDLSAFSEPSFILLSGIFPALTGSLAPVENVPEPSHSCLLFLVVAAAFCRRPRRTADD